jgi:hypothetical protein
VRLDALDRGHKLSTKALMAFIRTVSRQKVPDVVKLMLYRPDFFPMGALFQQVMRGPSEWSIGDREMMASFVSKTNECEF